MSAIFTFQLPTHREMLGKVRGAPVRGAQSHRNRWREAKNGQRKHKGAYDV